MAEKEACPEHCVQAGEGTSGVCCDHFLEAGACHLRRSSGQGDPGRLGRAFQRCKLCRETCGGGVGGESEKSGGHSMWKGQETQECGAGWKTR